MINKFLTLINLKKKTCQEEDKKAVTIKRINDTCDPKDIVYSSKDGKMVIRYKINGNDIIDVCD